MLIGVIGVVCVAVAALGRKVKKEREMVIRLKSELVRACTSGRHPLSLGYTAS